MARRKREREREREREIICGISTPAFLSSVSGRTFNIFPQLFSEEEEEAEKKGHLVNNVSRDREETRSLHVLYVLGESTGFLSRII